MAGWMNWAALDFGQSNSAGKVVTETLMPIGAALAKKYEWKEWAGPMTFAIASGVLRAKAREFPSIARNNEQLDAIMTGELWASSSYHSGVLRFDKIEDAITWILEHTRPAAPRVPSTKIAASLMANEKTKVFMPGYVQGDGDPDPIAWDKIDVETLITYWYLGAVHGDHETTSIKTLSLYVAGMCKMGNMTEQWRRSRLAQIQKDVKNYDFDLEKKTVEYVWDYYGVAFAPTPKRFAALFDFIQKKCKAKNMTRLSVTADQAKDQGCAVLLFIQQALLDCADFNWDRFTKPKLPAEIEISKEMAIFQKEFAKLEKDPYMRYSGETGISPKIANLGYLSKQLLDRAKGVSSVEGYKGLDSGNVTIKFRAWIDRVVKGYITAVADREAKVGEKIPDIRETIPEGFVNKFTFSAERGDTDPKQPPIPEVAAYELQTE